MKLISLPFILIAFLFLNNADPAKQQPSTFSNNDSVTYMFGKFSDDYDILYTINDSLWIQQPGIKYHILKWNVKEQYCIARNDGKNPGEASLYTRIDFMQFENMKPWLWGFCYTVYKAKNDQEAEGAVPADRDHPMKGCNGFPFSRMKVVE